MQPSPSYLAALTYSISIESGLNKIHMKRLDLCLIAFIVDLLSSSFRLYRTFLIKYLLKFENRVTIQFHKLEGFSMVP